MIAREIRKELKEKFPNTKFSVRSKSYSGGGSVTVKWTDFPTVDSVKEVTEKHESYQRDYATGEILLGANYFVFHEQKLSDELKEQAIKKLPSDIHKEHSSTYNYWLQREINEMYEDVKESYEKKVDHVSKSNKEPVKEVLMKEDNKDKSATKRQLWALHCITKMDTREWNLTREKASELIANSNSNINIENDINKIIH